MSSQMQAFGSWRIILLNSDDLGDDGDVLTRVGENAAAFRPGGGGAAAWGSITGTLADQTDLQAALDAVTFDQALNTDDAVVFGSVETPSIKAPDSDRNLLIRAGNHAEFSGGNLELKGGISELPAFSQGGILSLAGGQSDGEGGRAELAGGQANVSGASAGPVFIYGGSADESPDVDRAGGRVEIKPGLGRGAVDFAPINFILPAANGAGGQEQTSVGTMQGNGATGGATFTWAGIFNVPTIESAAALDLDPTGALNINGTPGVTAGPFTTITSITVTKGMITDLQGS